MSKSDSFVQMTVREVMDKMREEKDDKFVALVDALVPVLPFAYSKTVDTFNKSWNFNNPYEYYLREVTVLVAGLIEENIGKPISFFGRILGKRVLQWDTQVKVREVC